jgi:hypothetical protein
MYVAVRRYEGVTDAQKVGQVAEEGFVPIIPSPARCRDSWLPTWSMPATAY